MMKLDMRSNPAARRGQATTRRAALLVAAALSLAVASTWREASANAPPFVLIIHASNEDDVLSRDFLEESFLKKTTRWPDGEHIRPVDLPASSAVRRAFSEKILRRSVEAVKNYWQQRIFSGRDVPPPELDSDSEVVAYVAKHPGAIGYVSSEAKLEHVKPVRVR